MSIEQSLPQGTHLATKQEKQEVKRAVMQQSTQGESTVKSTALGTSQGKPRTKKPAQNTTTKQLKRRGGKTPAQRAKLKKDYLDYYSLNNNKTKSAQLTGIAYDTVLAWERSGFITQEDIQLCHAKYADRLRDLVHTLAVEGVLKPLTSNGHLVLDEHNQPIYSTVHDIRLLAKLLEAKVPEFRPEAHSSVLVQTGDTYVGMHIEQVHNHNEGGYICFHASELDEYFYQVLREAKQRIIEHQSAIQAGSQYIEGSITAELPEGHTAGLNGAS